MSNRPKSKKTKAELLEEINQNEALIQEKDGALTSCQHELSEAIEQIEQLQELPETIASLENELSRLRQQDKETAQLRTELSEAQLTIEEKDGALAICQEELSEIKDRLNHTQSLEEKIEQLSNDLASERKRYAKKEKERVSLGEQLDRLQARYEESVSQHKEQSSLLDTTKKRLEALEREALQPVDANLESVEGAGATEKTTLKAAKSTFRIDIYDRNGDYHGKVEHLLTRNKKAFTKATLHNILPFIEAHRPHPDVSADASPPDQDINKDKDLGSNSDTGETSDSITIEATSTTKEKPGKEASPITSTSLKTQNQHANNDPSRQRHQIQFYQVDSVHNSLTLLKNKPFSAALYFELNKARTAALPLQSYELTIYAKRMGSNEFLFIKKVHHILTEEKNIKAIINGISLKGGIYRLASHIQFRESDNALSKQEDLFGSQFINVT